MTDNLFINAILMLAIITVVKELPKLMGDLTGIKSEGMQIGIKDKLAAGGFLAAGAGVGAAIGGGYATAVRNKNDALKNGTGGWKKSAVAGFASGAVRGFKNGVGSKNFSEMQTAASNASRDAVNRRIMRKDKNRKNQSLGEKKIPSIVNSAINRYKTWSGAEFSLDELTKRVAVRDKVAADLKGLEDKGKELSSRASVRNMNEFYVELKNKDAYRLNENIKSEYIEEKKVELETHLNENYQPNSEARRIAQEKMMETISENAVKHAENHKREMEAAENRFQNLSSLDSYNNYVGRGYIPGQKYYDINGFDVTKEAEKDFVTYQANWDKTYSERINAAKDLTKDMYLAGDSKILKTAEFEREFAQKDETIKNIAATQVANAECFGITKNEEIPNLNNPDYEKLKENSSKVFNINVRESGLKTQMERENSIIDNNKK